MMAALFPTTTTAHRFPNTSLFLAVTDGNNGSQATTPMITPEEPCVMDDSSLAVPLAVLYSLLFVLGLAGNLLALCVFFSAHSKRNSVRVLLINVAFADLLLVVCLPFRVLYHGQNNRWDMGPTACKVVGNLFYMNMYISITLLGLISVDRYLTIQRGMQYRPNARRWSTVACSVIWAIAVITCLVMVFSKKEGDVSRCFQYKNLQNAKWKAYINLSLVAVFWFAFFALVVSYGKIALKLLRTSREKPDLPNAQRYTRTAKKSFFVLFLFTVCFVPYHLVRVFYVYSQITHNTSCFWRGVVDKANEVALLFSALSSCLDPVMYFLLSSSVRKEVLRLVGNVLVVREGTGTALGGSSTADAANGNRNAVSGQASTVSRNAVSWTPGGAVKST